MTSPADPNAPRRKMWKMAKKTALKPHGKVPAGIQGLTRSMGGDLSSKRNQKWEAEEIRNVGTWVSRSPAWAISLALHFVAAVILMNVVYFTQRERIGQVFRMTLRASVPGGDKQGDQDNGIDGKHNEDSAPKGEVKPDKPKAIDPGLPPDPTKTTVGGAGIKIDIGDTSGEAGPGGIYAGRGGAGKGSALRQYGGDGQSEQAVVDGLEWLARHQDKSGAWHPDGFARNCPRNDSCGDDDRGMPEYVGATTGLALLAYLGAGYSHSDDHLRPQTEGGPVVHAYTATVAKGLKYLCREQDKSGMIDPSGNVNMYVHGIASLCIIEAYSMTKDAELRPYAQRCINLIIEAQQDNGGWNYTPEPAGRGDVSITSWAVMAMRSARAAGLAVPKRAWDRARRFMNSCTNQETGNIAYCIQGPPTRVTPGCNAMVAIGMATRIYLGMPEDQNITGKLVGKILDSPPRYDGVEGRCPNWTRLSNHKGSTHSSLYYTYYATLALFHHGGQAWEDWNAKMRAATLVTQSQKGHQKGSWAPVVWDGQWGGRVYTTAFNIMNLEVYYRYLPCYQVGSEFGMAALVTDDEWDKVLADAAKGKFAPVKGTGADDRGKPTAEVEEKPDALVVTPKVEKDSALLLADLVNPDMMTRRNAAKTLSTRHEVSATPALIQASRVEKTSLRPVLVEYLGAFGDVDEVIEYLIGELDSGDERVARAAFTALKAATSQELDRTRSAWNTWWKKEKATRTKPPAK